MLCGRKPGGPKKGLIIAGAAAVYRWNVIDDFAARGKRKPFMLGDAQLKVSPYVAPQTGGFALSLNF